MKNYLRTLAGASALALLASGAFAQQSFILPNNSTYQGHLNNAPAGAPPTATGCTINAGSTDTDGNCTTSATSGSITFATAWNTAPNCIVADASATSTVSMPVYTVSTTQIVLTTVISAHTLFWHCAGKNGG